MDVNGLAICTYVYCVPIKLACLRMTSPKSGTSGTPDDDECDEPVGENELDEEVEAADFELTDSSDLRTDSYGQYSP